MQPSSVRWQWFGFNCRYATRSRVQAGRAHAWDDREALDLLTINNVPIFQYNYQVLYFIFVAVQSDFLILKTKETTDGTEMSYRDTWHSIFFSENKDRKSPIQNQFTWVPSHGVENKLGARTEHWVGGWVVAWHRFARQNSAQRHAHDGVRSGKQNLHPGHRTVRVSGRRRDASPSRSRRTQISKISPAPPVTRSVRSCRRHLSYRGGNALGHQLPGGT